MESHKAIFVGKKIIVFFHEMGNKGGHGKLTVSTKSQGLKHQDWSTSGSATCAQITHKNFAYKTCEMLEPSKVVFRRGAGSKAK